MGKPVGSVEQMIGHRRFLGAVTKKSSYRITKQLKIITGKSDNNFFEYMLIDFSIKNWKSFKNETCITLKASKERRSNETLARINNYSLGLLPVTVILGTNGSGKSNFLESIKFCKNFITNPIDIFDEDKPIGYRPFKLNEEFSKKETSFAFRILLDSGIYDYSFSLLDNCVSKESLKKITKTNEILIFKRNGQEVDLYQKNLKSKKESGFFTYAIASLPKKLLFLTHSIRQQIDELCPVYEWFNKELQVLSPHSVCTYLKRAIDQTDPLFQATNRILQGLDTGIDHLESEEIHWQDITHILASSSQADSNCTKFPFLGNPILYDQKKGDFTNIISIHKSVTGKDVPFNLNDESSGLKQILSLIPALYNLTMPEKSNTYVIDDFDRNFHSNLTHFLIEYFLTGCNAQNRSQLIFSAHDLTLLDLDLFRIDEIWMTEREKDGSTNLIPLSDYGNNLNNKDLINKYRLGRFCNMQDFNLTNNKLLKILKNKYELN